MVAYATAADAVANDGQGRNSPFTTALLKRLQEPGLEIGLMFVRVTADVYAQTGGRQRPEYTTSLLSEYYLNQNDRIAWERIRDLDDVAALRDFANKYPSSPHAISALNRLNLLERYAREREEMARRTREEERRRLAEEADAKRREELSASPPWKSKATEGRGVSPRWKSKRIAALEEQRQEEQKRVAALEAQSVSRAEAHCRLGRAEAPEEQKRCRLEEQKRRQRAEARPLGRQKRLEEQKRVAALEEQKRQQEAEAHCRLGRQKRLEGEGRRHREQKRLKNRARRRPEEQKRLEGEANRRLEEQKRQEEPKESPLLRSKSAWKSRARRCSAGGCSGDESKPSVATPLARTPNPRRRRQISPADPAAKPNSSGSVADGDLDAG